MEQLIDTDHDLVRQQLDAIQQAIDDGVFTIDRVGRVIFANRAVTDMFGYSPHEIVGQQVITLMPPAEREAEARSLETSGTSSILMLVGRSHHVQGLRRDGTVFPFHLRVRTVKGAVEEYYTCIMRDLTSLQRSRERILDLHAQLRAHNDTLEDVVRVRTGQLECTVRDLAVANGKLADEIRDREQIAEALQRREAQLESLLSKERELGELRSRFVSMTSHEFRTPLTTMLSSAEIIEMTNAGASPSIGKHTRRIREGIGYLCNFLDDFLQLGKLDVLGLELQVRPVALDVYLKDLVDDLNQMCKPGQEIELCVASDVGATEHSVNALRLVLTNLITNAIKYSDDGSAIDLIVERNGDELSVSVLDEGIGVPAEERAHLFERFFRASNALHIKGTGLGLHIAARYVEAMGGELAVTPRAPRGTQFRYSVPYRLVAP